MTKPVTIYGIKACDTMKKARGWLDAHKVAYEFHDYKAVGIDRARLQGWVGQVGWESLLNRSGTTFRKLKSGCTARPSGDRGFESISLQRRVSCEPEFRGRIPSRPWGIFSRLLRVAIGGTAFRDRHPALRCPPILSRR